MPHSGGFRGDFSYPAGGVVASAVTSLAVRLRMLLHPLVEPGDFLLLGRDDLLGHRLHLGRLALIQFELRISSACWWCIFIIMAKSLSVSPVGFMAFIFCIPFLGLKDGDAPRGFWKR